MSDLAHTQAVIDSEETKEQTSWSCCILMVVLAALTAPYRRAFKLYTWKPLRAIRAANGDSKVLIPLIRDWKEEKYAELQSVQVSVSGIVPLLFSLYTSLAQMNLQRVRFINRRQRSAAAQTFQSCLTPALQT